MDDVPKTALITGGNGNLGRLVANRLLAQGQTVITFDVPGTGSGNPHENEIPLFGDIRDVDALKGILNAHRPDTIYHLASLLSGSSETDLKTAWDINANASFNLINLAHETDTKRFFFASTVATYGEVDADPMPENFPQWPENMYGATKVAVERLGFYFRKRHGLDFRCLRFPLVISPFAPQGAVSAFPSHAFKAASQGQTFRFPVSATTGVATLFLEDVIDAIVSFCAHDSVCLSRPAYNLFGFYLSAGMVADAARRRFPGFECSFEPDASVEQLIGAWPDRIDDQAARRDWGWQPKFDFEASADRICALLAKGGDT
jgi:threonine 3-dehydrogenase